MKFKDLLVEDTKVTLQDKKFGKKKTKYIELTQEQFDVVSKDFENTRKDIFKGKKSYGAEGAKWTVYFMEMSGTYMGYGVSGDYTFGRAPSYHQSKLSGNVKAGNAVFTEFLKEYSL